MDRASSCRLPWCSPHSTAMNWPQDWRRRLCKSTIFEGIEDEILGNYGLNGGGAVGYELDRADAALGTPCNAVVLARSEQLPDSFYLPMEDGLHFSLDAPQEPRTFAA